MGDAYIPFRITLVSTIVGNAVGIKATELAQMMLALPPGTIVKGCRGPTNEPVYDLSVHAGDIIVSHPMFERNEAIDFQWLRHAYAVTDGSACRVEQVTLFRGADMTRATGEHERNNAELEKELQASGVLPEPLPTVPTYPVGGEGVDGQRLFDQIAHGDDKHREWLRQELQSFFKHDIKEHGMKQVTVTLEHDGKVYKTIHRVSQMAALVSPNALQAEAVRGLERSLAEAGLTPAVVTEDQR